MDQRSQELLLDRLRGRARTTRVLGEEEGGRTGTSGVTWVVDPIDGTVNYLYGIPAYAVSRRGRRSVTPAPGALVPVRRGGA